MNLEAKYNTKDDVRQGGQGVAPAHELLCRRQHEVLWRGIVNGDQLGEISHAGGISPAWPISYQEMEPYYFQAERLYQVHGERGEDPTEPAASGPYAYPAVSHEPRIQQLSDDLERIGLRPFHTPLGVMLDERSPRKSRCIRCATCDGHPLPGAGEVRCASYLRRSRIGVSQRHSDHECQSDALGHECFRTREIGQVIVERNGETELYSGDIVVVSCGAINSAALLLRSTNEKHPACERLGRSWAALVRAMSIPC